MNNEDLADIDVAQATRLRVNLTEKCYKEG